MTDEELMERITDVAYDRGHDICYLAAARIEQLLQTNTALSQLLDSAYRSRDEWMMQCAKMAELEKTK